MKKIFKYNKLEIGQVIPLVVLMIFAIIGMVALILDGGAVMSNRRTARAAADAGALAGAQRLCANATDSVSVAKNFAGFNGADEVTVTPPVDRIISVNTIVQNPSFFAKIFGEDNLTAAANATAGCFYPSNANRVLPVAFWYNSKPSSAQDTDCSNPADPCEIVNWDYKVLLDTLKITNIEDEPLPGLYIISDSTKVCEKDWSGKIVCYDMKQNASGGNRTWLDLSLIADTNNLKKLISQGLNKPMYLPAWVNGVSGNVSGVYAADNFVDLEELAGYVDLPYRMVYVPVFDLYCVSEPELNCSTDPDDIFDYLKDSSKQSYRLVGFAPFVLTCTTKGNACDYVDKKGEVFGDCLPKKTGANETNQPQCPGYIGYLNSLPEKEKEEKLKNTESNVGFEGYFVKNVPVDSHAWGTDGVDVGLYLISLIE